MAEPIVLDTIERLARALMATLAPATGVRATGSIRVTSTAGVDVELPANTYLVAVVDGKKRDELVYKTTAAWTLPAGTSEPGIPITSNIGGARHNLPGGTVLRFEPQVDGIDPLATLDAPMTDGSNAGALIHSAGYFEDLELANAAKDLFDAKVGDSGVLLVWTQSEPSEGAMGGLRQGSSRATRAARIWREHFTLFVVAGSLAGDAARGKQARLITQAVTRLLTDRMQNDDGEQLSTVGAGVEITHRARLGRSERHYIYGIQIRVNQTLEPGLDAREFERWVTTRYQGALPGREDPEPIQDLEVVDVTDEMP